MMRMQLNFYNFVINFAMISKTSSIMRKFIVAIVMLFGTAVLLSSCGSQKEACPAYSQEDTQDTEQVQHS